MVSPILARAAMRAAARNLTTTTATINNTLARRQNFSVLQNLRTFARSLELHTPYERLPKTSAGAAADWGRQVKRVGGQAAVYFPLFGIILGWPLIAKAGLDGRM